MARIVASVLAIAISCFAHLPAQASKVKTWQSGPASSYDKAKFKETVVSNQGVLRLSKQLKSLAKLDAQHVWDLVEDAAGNLVAATGSQGKLFLIKTNGDVSVLAESKENQALCLARTPEGVIYAGTGPGGQVLRIEPDGKHAIVADKLGKYVWSLAYDPQSKSLFAGTGPGGKIYRITPDGNANVFYTTKQDHILSLALDAGNLYAGTDQGGLVYRIDPAGKGFVIYHAAQNEIRGLTVDGGVVYAGTAMPSSRKAPLSPFRSPTIPIGPTGGGSTSSSGASKTSDEPAKTQAGSSGSGLASEESKGTPAAAPSPPPPGDNSLYRIAADGSVRELFRDKTMLLRLLRVGDRLLVGTGMQGQLFEVDETNKERTELARLDNGQILSLLKRKDGSVVIGTGDPGKLYVLDDSFAASGTVTSEVLDAKIPTVWGALSWKANTPAGTSIKIAVRSGNVAEPDDTWSAWSPEQTDPTSARAVAPAARYLQYRVTLSTKDPKITPEIRQILVRYQSSNQSPEITSLDVPDLDTETVSQPKKFKIKWKAVDPNEDELVYKLFVKKEGWKDWVLLEEDIERTDFDWDTTTAPSGMYQIKVTATDKRDNPPAESFEVEKVSQPVPITHLPPEVTVKLIGIDAGKATFEATATDPLVRLVEAQFTVDGKRWTNLFPADGLFDSKMERFRFQTDVLRAGAHVVLVRVRDAAGNLGSGDTVFSVPK
jgi:hypothetical protein